MTTEALETTVRLPDLALARVHLRLGSLGLARAELEAIAGQDSLDVEGLLDLAEARWRTGDLPGAGDAAQAYLASGGASALGYLVAAEAVAAIGRPTEARRLAEEVLGRDEATLDELFAGMPRSLIWPAATSDVGRPAGTLFDGLGAGLEASDEAGPSVEVEPAIEQSPPSDPVHAPNAADGPGLWDGGQSTPARSTAMPAPEAELEAGREALASGDLDSAALHLGIALRLSPALAPAVLDATASGGSSASLQLVRGDAYRLVGHETDARRAYASAAEVTDAPGAGDEGHSGGTE